MTEAQDRAFTDVEGALLTDPDLDVRSTADGLTVKGRPFAARLSGGDLVVDLPKARAADLADRGVATVVDREPAPKGAWVTSADPEIWVELATESHQFVGEPAVGRDS